MATHSNILAWRIPWMEEPGGLQSTGSQRIKHELSINTFTFLIEGLRTSLSPARWRGVGQTRGTGPCECSPLRGPIRPPFFLYFPVAPGGQGALPPSTPGAHSAHHEHGHVAQVLAVQGADIGLAGAQLAALGAPAPGPSRPLLAPPGRHGLGPLSPVPQ